MVAHRGSRLCTKGYNFIWIVASSDGISSIHAAQHATYNWPTMTERPLLLDEDLPREARRSAIGKRAPITTAKVIEIPKISQTSETPVGVSLCGRDNLLLTPPAV